jgi:hypothetical protein
MAVKIDNEEPNVFPLVEGIDVRDAGRSTEVIFATKVEDQLNSRHYQAELRTGQPISGPFGAVPEGLALPFACPRRRNLHFHSRA